MTEIESFRMQKSEIQWPASKTNTNKANEIEHLLFRGDRPKVLVKTTVEVEGPMALTGIIRVSGVSAKAETGFRMNSQ